ncbi:hypothetical protein [Negadavirga shengliensis]|uniref:Uncharacterized protein n=1 Tax=Negadavirga shengliensis TaxID=1389218 RepID=A0ABV9T8A7_9BACT
MIKKMFVATDNPSRFRFENQNIISIKDLNNGRLEDYFYNVRDKKNARKHIQLNQFLYYDNLSRYSLIPDDTSFTLTADDTVFTFTKGANLTVDLRIYTDLMATIFNEPNGLIQTEGDFRVILNTRNVSNTNLVFGNFVRPYFQLTRLDREFQDVFYENNAINKRLELVQKRPFTFGMFLNFFEYKYKRGWKLWPQSRV